MEKNNNISFEPLLHLFFFLGGITLALSGLTLISLKFFGTPLLFEGVIALFVGLICIYVSKLHTLMMQTLDAFKKTLETGSELMQNHNNKMTHLTDMFGSFDIGNENFQTISITDKMSPEELNNIKKQFPHLSGIIDTMINAKTAINAHTAPKFTLSMESMSIEQLQNELDKAILNDNYEKAAILRDLIAKKK